MGASALLAPFFYFMTNRALKINIKAYLCGLGFLVFDIFSQSLIKAANN
jgi:hypothetical protein